MADEVIESMMSEQKEWRVRLERELKMRWEESLKLDSAPSPQTRLLFGWATLIRRFLLSLFFGRGLGCRASSEPRNGSRIYHMFTAMM